MQTAPPHRISLQKYQIETRISSQHFYLNFHIKTININNFSLNCRVYMHFLVLSGTVSSYWQFSLHLKSVQGLVLKINYTQICVFYMFSVLLFTYDTIEADFV